MISFEQFSPLLRAALHANGMESLANEQIIGKFWKLTERMLQVNAVMNLTTITEPRELILRHYIDSLTLLPHIPNGAHVLDVGCGAGFPCLPLCIARPDLHVTALDSTAKKITYVAGTAELLALDNLQAISGRAEELAAPEQPLREHFDIVVSRAVARLNVLGELCLPFLRVDGTLLAMKGSKAKEEMEEFAKGVALLGGDPMQLIDCTITPPPSEDVPDTATPEPHALVIVKKVRKTKEIYPRKYAQILKKPL